MSPKPPSASTPRKATTSSSAKDDIINSREANIATARKSAATKVAAATPKKRVANGDVSNFADQIKSTLEQLSQRETNYVKVATEETEFLATNSQLALDALNGRLNPNTLDSIFPHDIVPLEGDITSEPYLGWIDSELEKVPETFEEHALRLILAWTGSLVFEVFVTKLGLGSVLHEKRRIMNERDVELNRGYMQDYLQQRLDELVRSGTFGTQSESDTSNTASSRCTPEQIERWMSDPIGSGFYRIKFISKENEEYGIEDDEDDIDTWRLLKIEMQGKEVVYQTWWSMGATIPYEDESLRRLLSNSEIGGEVQLEDEDEY
ncbi:hypothetical protein C8Q75DRAFT_737579 [Abortiporus biennis]|nr:hypothetical protein C8Q75DRAFT_737579 [Abortiporus biennis]